ncbi:hypothetical protein FQA39_LY02359 [Lamprigera yunnana]|nr:hypothetical protein FQA39_LY02359 [Lamprigera yunnana]
MVPTLNVDFSLATSGVPNKDDILQSVRSNVESESNKEQSNKGEEEEEEGNVTTNHLTLKEAEMALNLLPNFIESRSASSDAALKHLSELRNMMVVGFARRKQKLEEISQKLNRNNKLFHYRVVDLTKEEDILSGFKWVAENVGPVHILVNNGGVGRLVDLMEGDTILWKEVMDTNVIALCIATREAIKEMKKNNVDGHIVHINSMAGHVVFSNSNIYTASKFAVTALTEALRKELVAAKSKIKITSVSPGFVATDFMHAKFERSKQNFNDSDVCKYLSTCPALVPEDIANAVVYTLGTPPHVQVHEIMIRPVGETI